MPRLTPVERELFLAAHSGDVPRLSKLCTKQAEDGLSVNIVDEAGYTPLAIAIIQGNLEAVQTLVNVGADINRVSARDLTPILLACEEGEMKIVAYLLQCGAHPTKQCGNRGSLLHMAALYEYEEPLQWLVQDYGVPIDTPIQETGQTALHKASALHSESCVQWLLGHGANPCQADQQGKTALHYAVLRKFSSSRGIDAYAYANLLTSLAAARSVRDQWGRTALHVACYRQNLQAVKILMRLPSPLPSNQAKEDTLMTLDNLGRTPLFEACSNTELLQEILYRMQEIYSQHEIREALNRSDPQGWTPLHHAVFCDNADVVMLLLSHGASADIRLPGSRQSLLHLVGSGFKMQWDECGKQNPRSWHRQYNHVIDWLHQFGRWFVQHKCVTNGWPQLSIPPLPRFAGLEESFDVEPNRSSAMSSILLEMGKATVLVKDRQGNLPFFLSAASGNVSEVFEQLRAAAHEGLFHNLIKAMIVPSPTALTTTSPVTVVENDIIRHTGKRKKGSTVTPSYHTQRLRVETDTCINTR